MPIYVIAKESVRFQWIECEIWRSFWCKNNYATWTFQESGAVPTARRTAERRIMSIGVLQAGYSEASYAYQDNQVSVEEFYKNVSSAAEITMAENDGKVIGLTMIPYEYNGITYGMRAQYAKESTSEHPIVQVTSNYGGKTVSYNVDINEVDPKNASWIEMFALLSHTDEQGISDGGAYGSYQQMKVYAMNAQMNGYSSALSGYEDFLSEKLDWISIIGGIALDYFEAGVYDQYQNCKNLLQTFFSCYDSEQCEGYLTRMRSLKEEQRDSGDMVGYHQSEQICSVLNNYMIDSKGETQYIETETGMKKVQIMEGELTSGILGFGGMIDGSGYVARYADCSTAENPVVTVCVTDDRGRKKQYNIAINDIDPQNASQMEMFALLTHYEKQGISGDYKDVYYQGMLAGFFDAQNPKEFVDDKVDWQAKLEEFKSQTHSDTKDFREILSDKADELYEKLINGDTETSFQIGAGSYTEKEWNRLLKWFDAVQEAIREASEAREKKRAEEVKRETDTKQVEEEEQETDTKPDSIEDMITMLLAESIICTDPASETEQEESYVIAYDAQGIRCMKTKEGEMLWKIDFSNDSDYQKVADLMGNMSAEDNPIFACHEDFWQDFLADKIDIANFLSTSI